MIGKAGPRPSQEQPAMMQSALAASPNGSSSGRAAGTMLHPVV